MLDMNMGVVGFPVEHSLSPKIHNALYEEFRLPWHYGFLPAQAKGEFEAIIADGKNCAMQAQNLTSKNAFVGFNVTMPHKINAFEIADKRNVSSFLTGAANTVSLIKDGQAKEQKIITACDTTDGEGACRALEHIGAKVSESKFMVLGTGGAATSIVVSALLRGADKVTMVSRNKKHALDVASKILARIDAAYSDGLLETWGFGDDTRNIWWSTHDVESIAMDYNEAQKWCQEYNIIVNATPLGMKQDDPSPVPAKSFNKDQFVMDAVYAHGLSAFRKYANDAGAKSIDGLSMLVEQAILSMAIWIQNADLQFSTFDKRIYSTLSAQGIELPYRFGARGC